jgi:hypothetical protein
MSLGHDLKLLTQRAIKTLDFLKGMPWCYRQKLTWSIWAKKRAVIKMGFEDNHD